MLKVKSYEEAWEEAYALARKNQPLFIDKETMFTPIFFERDWIESDIKGYITYIYSYQKLSNDDVLSLFKRFLHLLKVERELCIENKEVEPHLRHLALLELPIYQYGQISKCFLDVFININRSSCLRYDKDNSFYNMPKNVQPKFFKLFKCCILSNSAKTKLYGRVFYSEKYQALVNIYPQHLRRAFSEYTVYSARIEAYFYVNEIICLEEAVSVNRLLSHFARVFVCDVCKEPYDFRDSIWTGTGEAYCEDCARALVCCDYCEEYYEPSIIRLLNDEKICQYCYDRLVEEYKKGRSL